MWTCIKSRGISVSVSQLQCWMSPQCLSCVRWDFLSRPAGRLCITRGTLASMLLWTGWWGIWMMQVNMSMYKKLQAEQASVHLLLIGPISLITSTWLAPDFAAPLVLPGSSSAPGSTPTESLSEEHLATIVSMGFSRDQASRALKATVRTLRSDLYYIAITLIT